MANQFRIDVKSMPKSTPEKGRARRIFEGGVRGPVVNKPLTKQLQKLSRIVSVVLSECVW